MVIIFWDFATVLIVILALCLAIGGGIIAVISYIMAHLTTIILILSAIGLVIALLASFLTANIGDLIPFALSFPPTVLYPLIIVIPCIKKQFDNGFFSGVTMTLLLLIPLLLGWVLIFCLGPVAASGIGEATNYENESNRVKGILIALFGGLATTGLQYLVLKFLYSLWVL